MGAPVFSAWRERAGRLADLVLRAGHGTNARWRGLPANTRRKLVGFPVSALFHLLLLVALVSTPAARQLGIGPSMEQGGRPNANSGRGLSVTLVSLAQLGEIGRDKPSTAQAVSGGAVGFEGGDRARVARLQIDSPLIAGGKPLSGDPAPQPSAETSMASAMAAAQGLQFKDAIQSGDAEAGQNLLRQIGRCLPPDHRPALAGVRLALQLDAAGQLTAAPSLDIASTLVSPETVKEASLVVQAALQCGPYQVPNPDVGFYAVAADFSFMGPPGLAPPRVMARHGR